MLIDYIMSIVLYWVRQKFFSLNAYRLVVLIDNESL